MEIAVGKIWRIKSTPTSFDVDHMEGKKKKEWKTKYSCSELSGAVQALFDHKVRAIESSDAFEIVEQMVKIKNELIKAIPNLRVVVDQ